MILVAILAASVAVSSPQPADIQKDRSDQAPPTNNQSKASPSTPVITNPSSQKRNQENQGKRSCVKGVLAWSERYKSLIEIINATAITVFTGLLAFFTVKLWTSGEKHSERELRAYVFPIDFKIRNFKTALSTLSPAQKISAFVTIKNTGQTPAYKFTCKVKMIVGAFPQTDFSISEEEADFTPSYLGPEGTVQYSPAKDMLLPHQHAQAVAEGNWALYVFGRIDYVDAFNVPRWTTFRTIARGDQGVMTFSEEMKDTLVLATDEGGNDAT